MLPRLRRPAVALLAALAPLSAQEPKPAALAPSVTTVTVTAAPDQTAVAPVFLPPPPEPNRTRDEGGPRRHGRRDEIGQLLHDEQAFGIFALGIRTELEEHLGSKAAGDPLVRTQLFLVRTDLALYFAENNAALSCSSRLGQLQAGSLRYAYHFAFTEAFVNARRASRREPGTVQFEEAMVRELREHLALLPRSAAMRRALQAERDLLAGLSAAGIEQDVRAKITPLAIRRHKLTMEDAAVFIRARHGLMDLVPLRDPLVKIIDAAIDARPREDPKPEPPAPAK